jgi:TolB-like protein/tetratricopeptide (TPR) repeat protein
LSLISELKRRNVVRVGAAYFVSSWLLIELADIMFEAFGFPPAAMQWLIGALGLGIIPMLIFSWVYELTPEGLVKDAGPEHENPENRRTGRRLDQVTIVVVLAALALAAVDRFVMPQQVEVPTTVAETTTPPASTGGPMLEPAEIAADQASIAVLPFVNMSGSAENEYFSDGLSETLLHLLAQVPDLRVAARTSSFQFKGRTVDIREVAQQLGVANVLEGSVQRQGDRVRITAQLIRGTDGSHIWSQNFDRTLDDIFVIQDEIAAEVSAALQVSLLGGNDGVVADAGGTDNIAAYEAYLRGVAAMARGTPEAALDAIAQFDLAIELDPDYGMAWARLSRAQLLPAVLGAATWESRIEPMLEAAERAVSVAPGLAEAHLALATARGWRSRDRAGYRASVERAVALGPNNPEALIYLSNLHRGDGLYRDALASAQRAAQLDPLDADVRFNLARIRALVGLSDLARAEMEALVAEYPDSVERLMDYARFLRRDSGDPAAAMRIALRAHELNPGSLNPMFTLAFGFADLGDLEAADRWLRRIETIAPDRAHDDRMWLCLQAGEMACFDASARRYVQLQREQGTPVEADRYEAIRRFYMGDAAGALELLGGRNLGASSNSAFEDELLLIAIYHRLGMQAERDAAIEAYRADIQHRIGNGLDLRYAIRDLTQIAALSGDGPATAERMRQGLRDGIAPAPSDVEYLAVFERVKDDPAVQEQLAAIEARDARILAELDAEGLR